MSGKEVVSRSGKIVPKLAIPSGEKVSEPTLFHKLTGRSTRYEKKKYLYPLFARSYADRHLCGLCITPKQESTGEYVDDSVITTKVKSLLAADDFLKSFQIGVETYKGTVQLSGFVNSQNAVDKAVQITRSVKGVKSVKNNLIVK